MKSLFETIAATQKTSLEATASFTDTCLIVVERLTQLNIDVTRTAFEKSSEVALLCWEDSLSQGNVSGWNDAFQSGIDRFSEYCRSIRLMTQGVAKH